jgi:hypothetical protein
LRVRATEATADSPIALPPSCCVETTRPSLDQERRPPQFAACALSHRLVQSLSPVNQ